jgi:hypothetical protein
MTQATVKTRQGLVQLWLVQMVGTLIISGVVLAFARSSMQLGTMDPAWKQYVMLALLAAGAPALLYLRHYRTLLLQDLRLERERGSPHPEARNTLTKGLSLGSALCEIPMALGVVQLLFGGETRWFLAGTMFTIALRLSYRPFTKASS